MQLAPELRATIYNKAFERDEDDRVNLNTVKLPPLLAVNKQIRREGLPIFFAATPFHLPVRSNWCVRTMHYHGPRYFRYEQAGKLDLYPHIRDGSELLLKTDVRIRRLDLSIHCVCCYPGIRIGSLSLRIVGRTPEVELKPVERAQQGTKDAMARMTEHAKEVVEEAARGERFNGFSARDIALVCQCFRIEHQSGTLED
jgi:hypothetical protein